SAAGAGDAAAVRADLTREADAARGAACAARRHVVAGQAGPGGREAAVAGASGADAAAAELPRGARGAAHSALAAQRGGGAPLAAAGGVEAAGAAGVAAGVGDAARRLPRLHRRLP